MSIYLSSAYLAPVEYYSKLANGQEIFIESCENYIKQSYRNRCNILSANGPMSLSIPVEHNKAEKCRTKDIRISYATNWQHLHWNAIVSAYNSTPFFEYYRDYFEPFYRKEYYFLFDFNEELRVLVCELAGIEVNNIRFTEIYEKQIENDYRELISPKKDWSILDTDFTVVPYYQVFAHKFGFTPNLSIIDLLFNMGNESLITLENSVTQK